MVQGLVSPRRNLFLPGCLEERGFFHFLLGENGRNWKKVEDTEKHHDKAVVINTNIVGILFK